MAGFGQPKTGGRQRGTPNRATLAFSERMDELREQLDVCPIQVLMEIAAGKKLNGERMLVDESVRVRAAAELLAYLFPKKRAAVEVSGPDGTQVVFAVVRDDSEQPV